MSFLNIYLAPDLRQLILSLFDRLFQLLHLFTLAGDDLSHFFLVSFKNGNIYLQFLYSNPELLIGGIFRRTGPHHLQLTLHLFRYVGQQVQLIELVLINISLLNHIGKLFFSFVTL